MFAQTQVLRILAIILVGCYFLAASDKAYAYLDPGTGSIVLQALIAGFFGSLFAIKMFWGRIVLRVRRLTGRDKAESNSGI